MDFEQLMEQVRHTVLEARMLQGTLRRLVRAGEPAEQQVVIQFPLRRGA